MQKVSIEECDRIVRLTLEEGFPYIRNLFADHSPDLILHSANVLVISAYLARELTLPPNEIKDTGRQALRHDVGKIAVPGDVLTKPGKLDPTDWLFIKEHPAAGNRITMDLDHRQPNPGIHHHHERWDGTGYPNKLAGEEISLAGRIIAVADAYDVITSERPYKKAKTRDEARLELLRCSGTQFDPSVVEAFQRIPPEQPLRCDLSKFLALA